MIYSHVLRRKISSDFDITLPRYYKQFVVKDGYLYLLTIPPCDMADTLAKKYPDKISINDSKQIICYDIINTNPLNISDNEFKELLGSCFNLNFISYEIEHINFFYFIQCENHVDLIVVINGEIKTFKNIPNIELGKEYYYNNKVFINNNVYIDTITGDRNDNSSPIRFEEDEIRIIRENCMKNSHSETDSNHIDDIEKEVMIIKEHMKNMDKCMMSDAEIVMYARYEEDVMRLEKCIKGLKELSTNITKNSNT